MNWIGFLLCLAILGIFAVTRWLCIWGEYHFTKRVWWAFLLLGLLCVGGSFLVLDMLLSSSLSVLGFCFLWGIGEVIQQEKRVRNGWFPANPKRAEKACSRV